MKKRTKALLAFAGTVAILVGSLLTFIQSKAFSSILKQVAHRYLPTDFGVQGEFSELAVKLIPPGVVIKNPVLTLKEKNPANLPAGTKLDAQFIDVTFQFFQLLTGAVTVNAFAVHGATLRLDLDEKFFSKHAADQSGTFLKITNKFSWDNLVQFNFRSVSVIDSQIDIRMSPPHYARPIHVQALAKELTVGRSTVSKLPSYDLAIDLTNARFEIGGIQQAISQFQASAEISSTGAEIRNLGVQDGDLTFHTNGHVQGNLLDPKTLKSDFSYTARGPIPKVLDPSLLGRILKLPKGMTIEGLASAEGSLSGDLLDLERTVETKTTLQLEDAHLGDWKTEKTIVKGAWRSPFVYLDSAEIHIGEGTIKAGKATFNVKDLSQPVKANLSLENLDFRRAMGSALKPVYPLHMFVSGGIDAEVLPSHDFSISGKADLTVRDFSFDNQKPGEKKPLRVLLATKEVHVKTGFEIDSEGVTIDHTEALLPHSRLTAGGTVDFEDGFNLDIDGRINLVDIGKLSVFDIGGEGDLHWTVRGKKPAIVLGFEAKLENAYYLNLNLGSVSGKVVYNDGNDTVYFENLAATKGRSHFVANGTINVGDTDAASMAIQVPRGTIQDFSDVFDDFIKKSVPWYPRDLTGQLNGLIKVSGKTDLDKLSIEGDVELQNIEYQHEMFRYAKMHAGYRRGAYIAENAFIRKKSGTFKGNFNYGADDVLKYDLHADGLTTLDLDRLASFGIPYRASIALDAVGFGKLGSLKSSARLNLGDGTIRNFAVPHSEFNLSTENGRIRGDLSVFGGELRGKMDIGWASGADSSIDLEAKQFSFEPILIGLNSALAEDTELDAEVTGAAHLRFQTGALSHLSGHVSLDSYSLMRRGFSLNLAAPVKFGIESGNYQFENAKLIGEGSSLIVSGRAHDGVVNYNINGPLNLRLSEFLVEEIASVRGSADVKGSLFGRADSPHFKATVLAKGFDLRLKAIEQPFEEAKFNVDWKDDLLDVNDVSARFAGGMIRGQGKIGLYSYKVPDMNFSADLDNSKVKVYPVVYARTSGKLNLAGTELPYKVKGALNVAEALITENFNPAEGSRILRSSKFLPQKNGQTSGEIQIFDLDVDLSADRSVFVRNDLFDAEVRGTIKVIGSIQTPRILGQASVMHGRLLFKDNFFTINTGNLSFKNPAVLDPEFDLSGSADVKSYKILLVANGAVSDPKINFQSQPPLSQNDIVNLLTLGVTSSGYQSLARQDRDAYSRDELYGLLFSQTGVNKGLQQKLGVKVRVDQSQALVPENAFRARSTTDTTENVAPKVVVQKEVTKNLNASVGSTVGLGESQERSVDLEYLFAKHWSVLGVYEDQRGSQPSQSRTSVGADLKFKIRFK